MDNIAVYTFSSIDLVHQCLLDKTRLETYYKGIKSAISSGCKNALDVGTGSGVLAAMAVKAGAKKVIAVEVDPYLYMVAKKVFEANNMSDVIQIIKKDVRNLLPEDLVEAPVDLVIMDLLTTGLIDEYQVQAVNSLHKNGLISSNTVFVPMKQITYISLAYADFDIYSLSFPIVRHIWKQFADLNPSFQLMSSNTILNNVSYNQLNPINFRAEIDLTVSKSGIVNAVYLTSQTWIDDSTYLEDTESLNAPILFPLDRFDVNKNEKVKLTISYTFGEGFSTVNIKRL